MPEFSKDFSPYEYPATIWSNLTDGQTKENGQSTVQCHQKQSQSYREHGVIHADVRGLPKVALFIRPRQTDWNVIRDLVTIPQVIKNFGCHRRHKFIDGPYHGKNEGMDMTTPGLPELPSTEAPLFTLIFSTKKQRLALRYYKSLKTLTNQGTHNLPQL